MLGRHFVRNTIISTVGLVSAVALFFSGHQIVSVFPFVAGIIFLIHNLKPLNDFRRTRKYKVGDIVQLYTWEELCDRYDGEMRWSYEKIYGFTYSQSWIYSLLQESTDLTFTIIEFEGKWAYYTNFSYTFTLCDYMIKRKINVYETPEQISQEVENMEFL